MIWDRLKTLQCPACNSSLTPQDGGGYKCSKNIWDGKCAFSIGKEKFESTIVSLYQPKHIRRSFFDRCEVNETELNNLDTGRTRSDFENMPTEGEE